MLNQQLRRHNHGTEYHQQVAHHSRFLIFIQFHNFLCRKFVLRVDAETMEAIEKWAADEFRSTNGQLQWIIAEALRKSGRMKKKRTSQTKEEEE